MGTFSVIGAGALGRHLAQILPETGFIETDDILHSDWIFVTVPDNSLQSVVDGIPGSVNGRIITCSASVLVKSENKRVESAHPLQTFPRNPIKSNRFDGIYWAVEPEASLELLDLIQKIRGKCFTISIVNRMLYHSMAVVASNLLIGLLDYAKMIGEKADLIDVKIEQILFPLVRSTVENYFENGFSVLSGPAKRNDMDLIKKQNVAICNSGIPTEIYEFITKFLLSQLEKK